MRNTSQWNNVLASVGLIKERLQKESIHFYLSECIIRSIIDIREFLAGKTDKELFLIRSMVYETNYIEEFFDLLHRCVYVLDEKYEGEYFYTFEQYEKYNSLDCGFVTHSEISRYHEQVVNLLKG